MDVISTIISEVVHRLPDLLSKLCYDGHDYRGIVETHLAEHLSWVAGWTQQIQFYGMIGPKDTESSTIPLRMASIPRKFRGHNGHSPELEEEKLLECQEHFLLLGDPGAGKTTTIKRMAARLLTSSELSDNDPWQYPIVIRFKDLDSGINQRIADILGIRYESKIVEKPVEIIDELGRRLQRVAKVACLFCCDKPLEDVVLCTLGATSPVLFLDGLDEVIHERREMLEEEIMKLAQPIKNFKIIVSCRSGDYVRQIQGITLVEVCPLEFNEINRLARIWLTSPTEFISELDKSPFRDIANRPLFLMQLIIFFSRYGYLPERPADVYAKVLNLLLEDWDAQRRIHRKSKYAGFTPMRKSEFLASMAYRITYKSKKKVFNTSMLQSAYGEICKGFGLPEEEASTVAGEIETHTGIIVQGSGDTFEFSHLSLQEFLAASYLCRAPLAEHLADYLVDYPGPLAIMVAISSDSSNTFAGLILSPESYKAINRGNLDKISSFLTRVIQEKPYFCRSKYLGLALLRLVSFLEDEVIETVSRFLWDRETRLSFCDALKYYVFEINLSILNTYSLERTAYFDPAKDYKLLAPDRALMPQHILESLRDSENLVFSPLLERKECFRVSLPQKSGNA